MFIKVSSDTYVNTDNINYLQFISHKAAIYFTGSAQLLILDGDAARFMLEMVEANDALILPGETPREPPEIDPLYSRTPLETAKYNETSGPRDTRPHASLRTKIAQMLRDTWKGVTLEQITAILHDVHDRSITQDAIDFTITELENEGVAIRVPIWNAERNVDKWLIYHTGSAEAQTYMRSLREDITASPDPASASEVPLSDADQTEHNEN